jgi:hypothetical protein
MDEVFSNVGLGGISGGSLHGGGPFVARTLRGRGMPAHGVCWPLRGIRWEIHYSQDAGSTPPTRRASERGFIAATPNLLGSEPP